MNSLKQEPWADSNLLILMPVEGAYINLHSHTVPPLAVLLGLSIEKTETLNFLGRWEDYGFEPSKCLLAAYISSLGNYSVQVLPALGTLAP